MALTKVTSGVRTLGTGEVATANMATDPTNADNLSSGSVPAARLGNVDTTGLEDDIALLGFKVASNGSLAKYNLVDQTVDDFQDASGVDASASTNEVRDSSNYYSGYVGGTISTLTTDNWYTTKTGTWTPSVTGDAEILLVAGGGGGAQSQGSSTSHYGGAGGGGGIVHHTAYAVVSGVEYDISVGRGGERDSPSGDVGTNSVFNINAEGSGATMTAIGGGGGGNPNVNGTDGGSGGGAGWNASSTRAGGSATQGDSAGGTGYGNDGSGAASSYAGGGGGAAAAGSASVTGGAGKLFATFNEYGTDSSNDAAVGTNGGYFGGGGGAAPNGVGGVGGGGDGPTSGPAQGSAGPDKTGGGGNGSWSEEGGSGRGGFFGVLSPSTGQDMTLISTTTAAQAEPTKGDIVLTYTSSVGSTTLDTDLTAEISADGGSTWTALALSSEGSTGSHNIATSHDVTITSTITAPWNMAYRIKTLNQSASKVTRIQAVSLGWS